MNNIFTEDFEKIISSHINLQWLSKKSILITGAGGMIGGYLTEFLLFANKKHNLGLKIFALVRDKNRSNKRYKQYVGRADLKIIFADVVEFNNTKLHFDIIVHAASQASPKYFGQDPVGTILANTNGTKNLLDISGKNNSKFLFISSSEVYGKLKNRQIPTKESDMGILDPMELRSCYAESKRLGEALCMAYFKQYKQNVLIVRPFHIYGPGMDLNDGRVFADFTRDVVKGSDILISSGGRARRTFCYLADAITGIIKVLEKGRSGEAYNIGNAKEDVSIIQLAGKLVGLFPEKGLKIVRGDKVTRGYIPSSVARSSPNTKKLEQLGWRPSYSVSEGFRRTILSFQ